MAQAPAIIPNLPEILTRYVNGESMTQLAKEAKVNRATLYRYMLKESGPDHETLITDALITRIAEADQLLDEAVNMCDVARAREHMKYSRLDFERRRPKLYGPKQEVDSSVSINVVIESVQPVENRPVIEIQAQKTGELTETHLSDVPNGTSTDRSVTRSTPRPSSADGGGE